MPRSAARRYQRHSLAQPEIFARIFASILAVELWARAFPRWQLLSWFELTALPIATVAAALAFSPRWQQWAFAALTLIIGATVWAEFPATGNHGYLELYFCLLLVLLHSGRTAESALLATSVRWLTAVVLFYSGVQKLVHGYYFGGEMLAYSLETDSFEPFLGLLFPDAELGRLIAFTGQAGDGPYTVRSAFVTIVSNLIWIAEIAIAVLLVIPQSARIAAVAAIAMVLAIEAGAREVFFGLVFVNALLLFLPAIWHRRAVPVFAVALAFLLAVRAGLLPVVTFY